MIFNRVKPLELRKKKKEIFRFRSLTLGGCIYKVHIAYKNILPDIQVKIEIWSRSDDFGRLTPHKKKEIFCLTNVKLNMTLGILAACRGASGVTTHLV